MHRHRLAIVLLISVAVLAGVALLIGSAAVGRDERPVPKSLPRISGTAQVGRVLQAHPGRWSRASHFTYQWQLCNGRGAHCGLVYGSRHRPYSNSTYKLVGIDAGHRMRLVVTAWNGGEHRAARSRLTAIIASNPTSGAGSGAPGSGTGAPGSAGGAPGSGNGGTVGNHQSVAFWLGWVTGMNVSQIPWNAVTQVDLFSLASCTATVTAHCPTPASINTAFNSIDQINVPQWVSTIHQHHRLALISIGGSTNPDWHIPCSSANVVAFASNLVHYMQSNGFDGIDLDIEQDPGSPGSAFSTAELTACAQNVHNDAKAIKTAAGNPPLITSDVDPTTSLDIGADENPYVDQFNSMGYGHTTAAQLQADLGALTSRSGIPASKVTLGIEVGSSTTPTDCGNIANYASTAGTAGAMLWYLQGDKNFACLSQIAPYVAPAP